MHKFNKTQSIALTGVFSAIIFLLTFTPQVGFIQVPLIGSATTVHIPVIIGSILLGPKYGAILGFTFGLASFIFASTMSTTLTAFAFTPLLPVPGTASGSPWALLIAFGPRMLVGIVPSLVFSGLMKIMSGKFTIAHISIAAIAGSATNTILVLHLIYFMFRDAWTYARETAAVTAPTITYPFVMGLITAAGIPEAIAAAVITPAVCVALFAVAARLPQRQEAH